MGFCFAQTSYCICTYSLYKRWGTMKTHSTNACLPLNWQQAHQSTWIETSLWTFVSFFLSLHLFIYCNGSFLGAENSHAFYGFSEYDFFFISLFLSFGILFHWFSWKECLLQKKEKPTPFACLLVCVFNSIIRWSNYEFNMYFIRRCL